MRPVLAACVALSLALGPGAGDGCQDPPSPSFSRSVPAPQLSAEELHSPHMPQSLRCDACYAIAFQVGTPKPRWGSRARHLAVHSRLLKREGKGGETWERGVTRGAAITGRFLPQLEEQLSKAEAKLGRKALRESDYVEVLERSCSQSWEL
ncbi:Marginal zone B- and B1-cell-specific protein [Aix galericulata]|nr:Marginal zone B- and B1-cell-specific protein [Aix galericulata]